VNEIAWNKAGDLFFITTGLGRIKVFQAHINNTE
jgi:hypothetical protein